MVEVVEVVEVVVEALENRSVRAVVRTIYEKARDLLANDAVKAIVYGIIATHIYELAIRTDSPPKITISPDLAIIESGKDRVIVPRDV